MALRSQVGQAMTHRGRRRLAGISLAFSMISPAAPALADTSGGLLEAPLSPALDALPANGRPPDDASAGAGSTPQASNLTLDNFFSEGWNQTWQKRTRATPDMALLRVTTNFLSRKFETDYVRTDVANNTTLESTDFAGARIAYGLNRRLMIELLANYQWNTPPAGPRSSGAGGGLLARFQLVDTPTQSYSFQARVSPPNTGIGQTQTSLTYAVAGWQDMHALIRSLGRFGLYGSFQYESLVGPHKAGAARNDISYDLSIAETWTSPSTPVFGNFTTFLEAFGTTVLDGSSPGKTAVSLTPGVRFWLLPEHSLILGLDLPVTHAPSFHRVFRATYILNF